MTTRTVAPAPAPGALDRWRRDTPGCRDRIHLNNAGAALMPQPVLETLTRHLEREAAIGGYEAADEAAARVRETYELVARLVGAAPRNIALVENATVAFSQALSAFDFPAGGVDPESVRRLARDPRTRLVAVSWVPTNSGLVQDARTVGEVCAELGVPYLVDACQSVGQMAVDGAELQCDYLAATGRQFVAGARGIGFLYASDRMLQRGAFPLFVDMRGADWTEPDAFRLSDGARRFENWEFAYALVLGLGEAARFAPAVGAGGGERAWALPAEQREQLAAPPGVPVLAPGPGRCANPTGGVRGPGPPGLKPPVRGGGVNSSSSDRDDGV